MIGVRETRLVQTAVGGDSNTLVLRRSPGDEIPLSFVAGETPARDDILSVTYHGAHRFLDAWRTRVGHRPRNVGVVSVGTKMRTAAAKTDDARNVVRGVADPADAGALHRSVEGYLDSWPDDGRTVVSFDSVTELLDGLDADAVATFLDSFLRSLAERDVEGYFYFTPSEHDEETVRTVRSLFDTVVESTPSDASPPSDVRVPSADDCSAVADDPRRRSILAVLADCDGDVSTDELVAQVTAAETADRRRVELSLRQIHLPKLAEIGVVARDVERGRVSTGPHFDRVEPSLVAADDRR